MEPLPEKKKPLIICEGMLRFVPLASAIKMKEVPKSPKLVIKTRPSDEVFLLIVIV